MEPAFKAGDRVVINRLAYLFSEPKPDDVVAVKHPKERDKILLKKIETNLSENQYLVVGINQSDSYDSRAFGPISKSLIIGEVCFKY